MLVAVRRPLGLVACHGFRTAGDGYRDWREYVSSDLSVIRRPNPNGGMGFVFGQHRLRAKVNTIPLLLLAPQERVLS